ncbi:MAG TPA: NADH-quinone oxidoreductase subunit C, partial [Paracoccaceae bacterium]|nr:NADH-quinone oxidoreductase subunit C [Paracoccaceae bacterium]
MTVLGDILGAGQAMGCRPWPRVELGEAGWRALAEGLRDGRWSLMGLWGEAAMVHMAVFEPCTGLAVATFACPEGRYPSVGALHAPAIRLERTVRDLCGLEAIGAPDPRPWLDHGQWEVRRPL